MNERDLLAGLSALLKPPEKAICPACCRIIPMLEEHECHPLDGVQPWVQGRPDGKRRAKSYCIQ